MTIFSKIINGEIPSYKVYEDDFIYAFLDINPVQRGHTLVVPKKEVDYLFDLDEETYGHLMRASKIVAEMLKEKLSCARVCVVVEGYEVPHAHVKLIPTNTAKDLDQAHAYTATEKELQEVQALFI